MRDLLTIVFVLLPATVLAEEVLLTPVQDAYICCCQPDVTNPNGGPNYLYHGQYGTCYDRSLIQWDLSVLPDSIVLESAEMRLYCEAFYGTESGYPVYYMIDEQWDQETVTYNTQPDFDTDIELQGYWPSANEWYSLDVTQFAEAWLNGSHVNYGIYCWCAETTGTCVPGFWSSDYSDEELRPVLAVDYQDLAFTSQTWAAIKTSADN